MSVRREVFLIIDVADLDNTRITWKDVIDAVMSNQVSSEMATDILEESIRMKLLFLVDRFVQLPTVPYYLHKQINSECAV